MNKAFVREESSDDVDEAAVPEIPRGKTYLTRTGCARLQAELEQLVKEERPALVQTVAWAASNGDRSENGDYIYGKKRLREIDRRIRYLMKSLENATVVDPAEQENTNQVFFGATVTVVDERGETARYQIVGVQEANAAAGLISWISPMARALMKASVGDVVYFDSPAGRREVEVTAIAYR